MFRLAFLSVLAIALAAVAGTAYPSQTPTARAQALNLCVVVVNTNGPDSDAFPIHGEAFAGGTDFDLSVSETSSPECEYSYSGHNVAITPLPGYTVLGNTVFYEGVEELKLPGQFLVPPGCGTSPESPNAAEDLFPDGIVTICFFVQQNSYPITVHKVNLGGNPADSFTFDVNPGGPQNTPFSQSAGPVTVNVTSPGTYTISEDPKPGYTYVGWAYASGCPDSTAGNTGVARLTSGTSDSSAAACVALAFCPAGPTDTGPAVVDVGNGNNGFSSAVCLYNEPVRNGTVQVIKKDYTIGTASWGVGISGPLVATASVAGGNPAGSIATFNDAPPGVYTASEVGAGPATCPAHPAPGTFRTTITPPGGQTLAPGGTITFIIENAPCTPDELKIPGPQLPSPSPTRTPQFIPSATPGRGDDPVVTITPTATATMTPAPPTATATSPATPTPPPDVVLTVAPPTSTSVTGGNLPAVATPRAPSAGSGGGGPLENPLAILLVGAALLLAAGGYTALAAGRKR